jgi:hypothetical protein
LFCVKYNDAIALYRVSSYVCLSRRGVFALEWAMDDRAEERARPDWLRADLTRLKRRAQEMPERPGSHDDPHDEELVALLLYLRHGCL